MTKSIYRFQMLRKMVLAAGLLGLLSLTGCASFYVDTATKEIPAAAYKKPAEPHPVQLVFEFQTKGVTNARATEYLSAQVKDQIKGSGLRTPARLFGRCLGRPRLGGAKLARASGFVLPK